MANCEVVSGCIFFNDKMANKPATAEIYKKRFCQGDNSECARYLVFKSKGKGNVPADLFPNQIDRAKEIIEE